MSTSTERIPSRIPGRRRARHASPLLGLLARHASPLLGLLACLAVSCTAGPGTDISDPVETFRMADSDIGPLQADLCAAAECRTEDPCTTVSCNPVTGACLESPAADGIPCDDFDPCTTGDECTASTCAGTPIECHSAGICNQSSCEPETGQCAQHPLSGPGCDDGNLCTTGDTCIDGACQGNPIDCDDGNPCTSDSCDAVDAACRHVPIDGNPCDDLDPCTVQDQCIDTVCAGLPSPCDDDNPCTADSCLSSSGECAHSPLPGTPCEDGNACTADDSCAGPVCTGKPLDCNDGNDCTVDACLPSSGCSYKTPQLPCDDGNPCTQSDTCSAGQCLGTPLECGDANPCTLDSCDPASGACQHLPADWPCDDSSLCTSGDTCVLGACVGQGISCDDANPCTADSCLPLSGCKHLPVNAPCDDGNACTLSDLCLAGSCQPGKYSPPCDDGNPCTADSCLPADGSCIHKPVAAPCDDGNPCTADDHCDSGVCIGTDQDVCQCANDADCAPFEDASKCNGILFCDKAVLPSKCKLMPGSLVKCSTLYDTPCRKVLCQPETGVCLPTDMPDFSPCNDGNPCTTGDHCLGGECTHAAP
ncbi:MAG: hypothetical protein FJ109_17605, partial [Deltaproteobacteria bacterium]|nr:hypothetical protein [Deltaproteobacteria bacterium]